MKYYAVYRGKSGAPKIFTSWDQCKQEVLGFKGAIYKSFPTEKEAVDYIAINSGSKIDENINSEDNFDGIFIYVDGSFMVDKGNFSYGLVVVENNEIIYTDKGKGFDKEAISLRNVSGEVLGAKKAVEFAIESGYGEITIAYDYQGVESWALGTWKRNNRITSEYYDFMQEKMKKINIKFKKIKGHSGDKYNEMADQLAKSALNK